MSGYRLVGGEATTRPRHRLAPILRSRLALALLAATTLVLALAALGTATGHTAKVVSHSVETAKEYTARLKEWTWTRPLGPAEEQYVQPSLDELARVVGEDPQYLVKDGWATYGFNNQRCVLTLSLLALLIVLALALTPSPSRRAQLHARVDPPARQDRPADTGPARLDLGEVVRRRRERLRGQRAALLPTAQCSRQRRRLDLERRRPSVQAPDPGALIVPLTSLSRSVVDEENLLAALPRHPPPAPHLRPAPHLPRVHRAVRHRPDPVRRVAAMEHDQLHAARLLDRHPPRGPLPEPHIRPRRPPSSSARPRRNRRGPPCRSRLGRRRARARLARSMDAAASPRRAAEARRKGRRRRRRPRAPARASRRRASVHVQRRVRPLLPLHRRCCRPAAELARPRRAGSS